MSKYYTPSIGEFHLGFRFDLIESSPTQTMINNSNSTDLKPFQYIEDERTWSKCTYLKHEPNRCNLFQDLFGNDGIENNLYLFRVKYLDKDDVEELGWAYKGNHYFYEQDEWYEMPCDEYSNYYLHKYAISDIGRVGYTIIQASPGGYSLQGDDLFKFDGEIRNYNELKFIMDRTGINSKG